MFKTIEAIINELKTTLQENRSCHQMNPFAADQEMLWELTTRDCIDEENCTYPNCKERKRILTDCLNRWERRHQGYITESDTILILYCMLRKFYVG